MEKTRVEKILRQKGLEYEFKTKFAINGKELDGVAVKTGNVSPIIYYNDITEEDFTEKLEKLENMKPVIDSDIIDRLKDKEYVLANVTPMLVNTQMNAKMLENAMHRPFLNLTVIYKVNVDLNGGSGSLLITTKLAENLGIDIDTLHESAMKNIKPTVKTAYEIISELMQIPLPKNDDTPPLYVVSNESKHCGASTIMLDSVLDELHDKLDSDMIIVQPSSIHEVIVKAIGTEEDVEHFAQITKEVNESQVSDEEVLENCAYLHTREGGWKVYE